MPPWNPQQMSASSFGCLHVLDRQRDSKHENGSISSERRRAGTMKFTAALRWRKKTLQTFACLTFSTKLVNRQRFVRTAWRQMQTLDACRWWVLSPRGGYIHCLWLHIRKKGFLLIWILQNVIIERVCSLRGHWQNQGVATSWLLGSFGRQGVTSQSWYSRLVCF